MSDPSLTSCHLEFPRRQEFREARATVLASRGPLTEQWLPELSEASDWLPSPSGAMLPDTRFLLIDKETACRYPLKTGLNTIGRNPENDIVIEDKTISRVHCALVVHARGGCELDNAASLNGTYVNGCRLSEPRQLKSGDSIKLANRELFFFSMDDCQGQWNADVPDDMTVIN